MSTTVCFTGRRVKYLCGYDASKYKNFVCWLTNFLDDKYYSAGVRTFISGGAQGFDQLAFWAVHNLKSRHPDIRNIVYVPFKGQESRWAATGPFSQTEYNQMIKLADEVKYLYTTPGVQALIGRNHDMVNASDEVIALYDGVDYSVSGGTAECIHYAKSQNKPIMQLWYSTDPELTVHTAKFIH